MPIIIGLAAVVLIIGLANVGNLLHHGAKETPRECASDASCITQCAAGYEFLRLSSGRASCSA